MRTLGFVAFSLSLLLGACSNGGSTSNATSSAQPAASAQGSEASASPAPGESPQPAATSDSNLLSVANGAYVRSYPADLSSNPDGIAVDGAALNAAGKTPAVFVYELPTAESISTFKVAMPANDSSQKRSVTVATSVTGADSGFSDIGGAQSAADGATTTLNANRKARWVRVTADSTDRSLFDSISAQGEPPGPRASNAPVPKVVVELENPYAKGAYNGTNLAEDPYSAVITVVNNGLSMTRCSQEKLGRPSEGTWDGRVWTYTADANQGRAILNDEGTIFTGQEANSPVHLTVTDQTPKPCQPRHIANGPNRVLILDSAADANPYPFEDEAKIKKYSVTRIPAGLVNATYLANADMAIFNAVCISAEYLSPGQNKLLDDWVFAGHKVAMYDSDMCGAKTHYEFLPYQFETSNPGAGGAHGDRLIEVESNDLGSLDPRDTARYLDALAYAKDEANQLGDANTTITKDDHWCGHLFGTNSKNVNGFMQMYAPYGKGVFIYNGLDQDDSSIPGYQRARDLELDLKLPGDLPCNVKAGMAFVLQPNRDAQFTAGTAKTLPFAMEVLANQGWKGHVTAKTTGNFPATVSPASFDLAGGTQALKITVSIPKSATTGTYAVTVIADDGNGKTSQAVVTLTANAPLKKQLKSQKRIRLYGIHFDTDSAHIQPRSEPVIKQIADLMKDDKALRFQVEGHTDSDGGAAYNMKLSQRRAQAVVDDLVKRYHIARSRLIAKGFGLTKPVASNATAGGKALNRRVELLHL